MTYLFLCFHYTLSSNYLTFYVKKERERERGHSLPSHTTTAKLQLQDKSGRLTTTELKKPHPPRLVRRAQMQNGLAPQPRAMDKNSGEIHQV